MTDVLQNEVASRWNFKCNLLSLSILINLSNPLSTDPWSCKPDLNKCRRDY